MRIVFMGTPDFAVASLNRLYEDGHEILAVFTQPDKPQGRKMKLTPPAVKTAAAERNIPVYQPETFKNECQLALLQELAPELIVVVAYGKLLPEYVLNLPPYGCINVHGSLLPKYRGAAPIQWSVLNGEKTAGVTTMFMDKGLDTGDMLLKRETPIGAQETSGELYDRLAAMGAELLSETISHLKEGNLTREKQDDSKATYAPMLNKEMAIIDWSKSGNEILNLVRGLNPWPIAVTTIDQDKCKIFSLTATGLRSDGVAGEVVLSDPKIGLHVVCGTGDVLRVEEIQLTGSKRMHVKDYLRGHAIPKGMVLGSSR